MLEIEGTSKEFASLSLKDLLEARDLYHFHLINKANVIGTAIGRFLRRKPGVARSAKITLQNTQIEDSSWPCVLVLVKNWVEKSKFGTGRGKVDPYEMVPEALYLPDGRRVPVCVVAVEPELPQPAAMPNWIWPRTVLGPGYPILIDRQGQEHRATIGCLVSDGHTLYALTSQHVCGTEGDPIYTMMRSTRVRIGQTSAKQVTRLPFSECYPDFPSRRTFVNLDVGLCRVDDASNWTSRVYGLPQTGPVAELNEANISLRLINAAVCAYGAASGKLDGRIMALFYRYKSTAGFDFVSDFLIAPLNGAGTVSGDSGAVWHLLPKDRGEMLRPFAIEWGGQAFANGQRSQFRFALATSLSSACKQLEVDVVRGDDPGVRPFWGRTGHYDIATFACDQVKNPNLRILMRANVDRISFAPDSLDPKVITEAIKTAKETEGFVPLADVPDIIWKNYPNVVKGGRDRQAGNHGPTGPEHPGHFADIDEPAEDSGKTLRQLSLENDANISPDFWGQFYTKLGHKTMSSRGLLPFRVWQHFKTMVEAIGDGNVARFVAAAGTLSHFVGDACQPLHGSIYADGFKNQQNGGSGIHSAYESNMIDRYATDIVNGVQGIIGKMPEKFADIRTGRDAAKATIQLMDRAATRIPPAELIQTFIDAGGKKNIRAYDALWNDWSNETIETMADGARVLAWIWDCAWREGEGNKKIQDNKLKAVPFKTLQKIYEDETFVPSLDLNHIHESL
jgi:hypothetical protein